MPTLKSVKVIYKPKDKDFNLDWKFRENEDCLRFISQILTEGSTLVRVEMEYE